MSDSVLSEAPGRSIRIASGLVCAVALMLPAVVGRWLLQRTPPYVMVQSLPFMTIVAASALVHSIATGRVGHHVQTAALSACCALLALSAAPPSAVVVAFAIWLVGGVLAWKLPIESTRARRVLVIVCIVVLLVSWRHLQRIHAFMAFQVLWVCEVMASKPQRSWLECHRAMSSLQANVPPDQLLLESNAPRSRLTGALWYLLGFGLLLGALHAPRFGGARMDLRASSALTVVHHPLGMVRAAADTWTQFVLVHCGRFFVVAGVIRALGIPVEIPIGNLFAVSNLLEYWSTINRWRWKMLRSVLIANFFPLRRDAWAAASIVAVFMISALQHAPGANANGVLPWSLFARWLVHSVLASATYFWLMARVRRRMKAVAAGAPVARTHGWAARVGRVVVDAICCCLVFLTFGFLMLTIR